MSGSKATTLPDSSRSGKKHDANADDRISNLPDSIIGEILSFLPTSNAVATGILSKRWKLLWTLVADLDFSCPENHTGSVEHFVDFVNSVLLSHKHGCFQKLSLTWETGCIPFYIDTWIGAALDRNVSELFVCAVVSSLPIQVQSSLFRSESLKSLELNCNICISTSDFVFNLPRLERLKLISVYFENFEAIGKILNGCPVLKYLIIYMDVGKMVEHGYLNAGLGFGDNLETYGITMTADADEIKCAISSASLTHLEIRVNAINSSPIPLKVLWFVALDVPSLRYIMLDGFLLGIKIPPERLAFFDEANIEMNGPLSEEPNICEDLVRAFSAFGCAKTLTLQDQVIRVLSYSSVKMTGTFERLTRLEVSIDCSYWSSLLDFIMLSDNLEALIVHMYRGLETDDVPHDNNSNSNETDDLVPRCLSKSLQTVSVGGYYGHRDELAMIEYIIKHASVLKIMEIGFGKSINDFKRMLELVQEIGAFPRKSKTCEVKFHN